MKSMNYAGLDIHKKHQLLCAPGGWHDYPGEHDRCDPSRAGRVDAATATAMDGRHGGHAVYRVDL